MRLFSIFLAASTLLACDKVDYLELSPEAVVLKQPNTEVWVQAKAMAHTGKQAPRVMIAWSVKDPSIATVDDQGKVRPVKSGHTEVIATHKSITASVPVDVLYTEKVDVEPKEVTVTEGGDPIELKAKAFDYLGRPLKDRTPTYKSSDAKVVSMGQNAVFGLAPGSAVVDVQVDGAKTSVKVVVEADKAKPKK
jgi:uncharacterized protein YjdB